MSGGSAQCHSEAGSLGTVLHRAARGQQLEEGMQTLQ